MRLIGKLFSGYRNWAAAAVIIVLSLGFLAGFGRTTAKLPLLGDHCMKTTKSIEVAYNLVRYKDFLHEYVDWKALPKNPKGRQGSILRYESPLSAVGLGIVYKIVGGDPFEKRIAAARIFTWMHLALAYLLLAGVVFRKDLTALAVFSFLFIGSAFTVSYSTKPLAETYSLLYQALLIVVATVLLEKSYGAVKKSVILAAAASLLCLGGKMNYFFVAFPLLVGYPLLDRHVRGLKRYARYFALFVGTAALGVSVMLLFTEFSFYKAFIFMVKGNKPIIHNSLWATFWEGFEYVDAILKRTKGDFGGILFDWGRYSLVYLSARFLYLAIALRKRSLTRMDRFSAVLFLAVLGHSINYVALRNLFIPHRYYVVPLFMIACLALTVLVADLRSFSQGRFPGKVSLADLLSRRLPRAAAVSGRISDFISKHRAVVTAVGVFAALSGVFAYVSVTLANPGFRTTAILTFKTLGHGGLALDITQDADVMATTLKTLAVAFGAAAGLAVIVGLLQGRISQVRLGMDAISARLGRAGVQPTLAVFFVLLLIPAVSIVFQNGRIFYEYAASHSKVQENARALEIIRKDTTPGDLVLAWKPCYAFYADKRSILEPRHDDLPYYRANDIHSVMGPVKPFNKFYKRIEKYPEPMSYWAPKSNVKKRKKRNAKKKN